MKLSTPDEYFADVEKEEVQNLCTWSGELYLEMHNGTYTTQSKVCYISNYYVLTSLCVTMCTYCMYLLYIPTASIYTHYAYLHAVQVSEICTVYSVLAINLFDRNHHAIKFYGYR